VALRAVGSRGLRPTTKTTDHVLCFGNLWHGDDGVGVHVFRQVSGVALPPWVRVYEAGIAGLNALPYFEGCRRALLVDAIAAPAPVGTVLRLRPADCAEPRRASTAHELGVNHLLAALAASTRDDAPPEVSLVGVVIGPARRFTDELSERVRAAVPEVVRRVLHWCQASIE
jgi:hydrogenase maturation protease